MDNKEFFDKFSAQDCSHLYEIIDKSIHNTNFALEMLDTLGDLIRKKEELQEAIKPEPWTNEIEPACSSWKDVD